ncbi:type I methionyl aminopeptidase [Candidatus Uhrbacteria bacterium]|nr:type I methionyl aminopeptidase [Candidatus Uhrbacteria bacterium]
MALIKTTEDIENLRIAGALLSKALGEVIKAVKPGVTMADMDKIAEKTIRDGGGKPAFLGYKAGGDSPFPSTVCISRNEEVIHGTGDRTVVLEEGDIVGFDIGLWMNDVAVDMAMTVPVGDISGEARSLLNVTKAALANGIKAAKAGVPLQNISQAVENTIKPHGYGIVTSYGGHGVGHEIHEEPFVPNYVSKHLPNPKLKSGMVLALEPMVTLGTEDVDIPEGDWTVVTGDNSWAAHFEQTIAINETGAEIITPFPEV